MGEQSNERLTGQRKWLQGKTLYWRRWVAPRESWDHDHCEFCFAHICDREDGQPEGWTTEDEYHWVCKSCCEDFREVFEWSLVKAD